MNDNTNPLGGFTIPLPIDQSLLDRLLERVALSRLAFEKANDPIDRDKFALDAVIGAMMLARKIVGEELIAHQHDMAGDADAKSEADLLQLAGRLQPLLMLYGASDRKEEANSVNSLLLEIMAVANGDEAVLLKKRRKRNGRGGTGFRADLYRLRAVCWVEFFKAQGMSAVMAEGRVCDAYGLTDNKALRDNWKFKAEDALGSSFVTTQIELARKGLVLPFQPAENEYHNAELTKDGEAYQQYK